MHMYMNVESDPIYSYNTPLKGYGAYICMMHKGAQCLRAEYIYQPYPEEGVLPCAHSVLLACDCIKDAARYTLISSVLMTIQNGVVCSSRSRAVRTIQCVVL